MSEARILDGKSIAESLRHRIGERVPRSSISMASRRALQSC